MNLVRASADRSDQALRSKLDGSKTLLEAVVRERIVKARSDILCQGEIPTVAHVLLQGHAFRYRQLSDGRRQITAVLVPGDLCDVEAVVQGRAYYSVGALTTVLLGEIPAERFADPTALGHEMSLALWRRQLRDEAISREWLVGIGRRTALERVAHFLCELRLRVDMVGLARAEEFEMQLTQSEFADVLGMSINQIDIVFQQFCKTGLMDLSNGIINLIDRPALEIIAGFDAGYLHQS